MFLFELVLFVKTDILDNKTKYLHTKCFPKWKKIEKKTQKIMVALSSQQSYLWVFYIVHIQTHFLKMERKVNL